MIFLLLKLTPVSFFDFKRKKYRRVGPEVYLVERIICNDEVGGSTPPGSTSLRSVQAQEGYFVTWLVGYLVIDLSN